MGVIRGLLVKVSADTAELKTAMVEAADVIKETGEAIESVIDDIKHSFATLAEILVLKEVIDDATKASDAMSQLDSAVRSTGATTGVTSDSVRELSESLAQVNGASAAAVMQMESMLVSFNRIGAEILPRVSQAAMDLAARFRMDLPEAAMLLGKAMENPIRGMTMLKRSGIILTEAQKDQIESFLALNDVAGAQKVILDQIDTQIGGAGIAKRASLAGANNALAATFEKLTEEAGGGDNGGLRFALELLNDLLQQVASNANIASGVFAGLTTAATMFFAATAAGWANNILLEALNTEGLSLIGPILIGLTSLVVGLANTNTQLGSVIRNFASMAYESFKSVVNIVLQLAHVIGDVVSFAIQGTINVFKEQLSFLQSGVAWATQNIPGIGTAFNIVGTIALKVAHLAGEGFKLALTNVIMLVGQLKGAFANLVNWLSATFPTFGALVRKVSTDMNSNFVGGFFGPVEAEFKKIGDQIQDMANKAKSFSNQPLNLNGADLLPKGKQNNAAAREAKRLAEELARSEEQISAALQRQTDYAQELTQRMHDQLSAATARTRGEEDSLEINRQIQEVQSRAKQEIEQIVKATKNGTLNWKDAEAAINRVKASAAQLVQKTKENGAALQVQKVLQEQQKIIIDAIDKSHMSLNQKANAWTVALKAQLINQKEYDAELQKIAQDQAKITADGIKAGDKAVQSLKDQIADMNAKINGQEKLLPLLKMEEEINSKLGKDGASYITTLRQQWAELQKLTQQYSQQKKLIDHILNSQDSQRKKQAELNALLAQGKITQGELDDANEQLSNQMTTQVQLAGQFSNIINQAFQMMTQGAKNFGKQLDQLLVKMVEMIAKALILATLTAVFDPAAVVAAGGFMNMLGSTFTKMFGLKLAGGGTPPMGKVSLVGENGPELFVPDTAGTIVPNSQLMAMGTGAASSASQSQGQSVNIQLVQKIPANIRSEQTVGPNGSPQVQLFIEQAFVNGMRGNGPLAQFMRSIGAPAMAVQR